MFVTKDNKELKWYWVDGKMHTVKVEAEDDLLDLKELRKECLKIAEEREELCKKIYYLGISLTGSGEGGWGFLMGWLMRSVKGETSWAIDHLDEEIPEEELREHLAEMMEEAAKAIREGKDGDKPKSMTPMMGGNDGTELFK